MGTAVFNCRLTDAAQGLWHCDASVGGIGSRGAGHGKSAAKRKAAEELLGALRELAASQRS